MNFFKRTALLSLLSLTLFAAGLMLQQVLEMYQNDTLRDHPEAIKALKDSANNNADAAFLLATGYKEGRIGAIDLKSAYDWYMKAANLGDADAMLMIGWLYYQGDLFGGSDLKRAKYWFLKAADKGIDEAIEMLEILSS
jgi:TPR repeat protein